MADFLNRMLGRNSGEEKGSGATAKDRLKMVLTHDRIQVSPEKLKEMRAEIIAVISKYVPEIDPDSVDISIEQTDRYNNRIVAQIPFAKTRGKVVIDSEENTDLVEPEPVVPADPDTTTLPHLDDEGREALKPYNPDDDEPTIIIDTEDEDNKANATKSELKDAQAKSDSEPNTETVSEETSSNNESGDNDSSDDSSDD